MATTTKDLLIAINVEAKNASKQVRDTADEVDNLGSSTDDLAAKTKAANQQTDQAAQASAAMGAQQKKAAEATGFFSAALLAAGAGIAEYSGEIMELIFAIPSISKQTDAMVSAVAKAMPAFTAAFSGAGKLVSEAIVATVGAIRNLPANLGAVVGNTVGFFKDMSTRSGQYLKELWSTVSSFSSSSASSLGSFKDSMERAFKSVPGYLASAGAAFTGFISNFKDWQTFVTAAGATFSKVRSGVQGLIATMEEFGPVATLVTAAGLSMIAKFTGIGLIVDVVTNAVINFGHRLFTAFDFAIPAAVKLHDSVVLLERAISTSTNSVGEQDSVTAAWADSIEKARANTYLLTTDITTMASQIVKLGQTFKLPQAQQEGILQVASALVSSGESASDVMKGLSSALAGNSLDIAKFGIATSNAELNQTAYAKSINKSAIEMNSFQIAQAAAERILNDGTVAIENASDKQLTYAETTRKIKDVQADLYASLGRTSTLITQSYATAQLYLLQILKHIPSALVDVTTALITTGGSLIEVGGLFLKYGGTIALAAKGINALNSMIQASSKVQTELNAVFTTASAVVGAQTIQITGLASIFKNLGFLLSGALTRGLALFVSGATISVTAIKSLTAAMLSNPLIMRGAIIATTIGLAYEAVMYFREEIKAAADALPGWTKTIIEVSAALLGLGTVLKTSSVAQAAFISGVQLVNAAMGLSSISITTVGAAFASFGGIAKTIAFTALPALVKGLGAASLAVLRFTGALLVNPFFLGAVAVIGTIVSVAKAFSQLTEELSFLKSATDGIGKSLDDTKIGIFQQILESLLSTLKKVGQGFVNLVKIPLAGLIETALSASKAFYELRALFGSQEDEEAYAEMQLELSKRIKMTDDAATNAWANVKKLTGATAMAATANDDAAQASAKLADELKNQMLISSAIAKATELQSIQVETMGDEYDKASRKVAVASEAFRKATDAFDADDDDANEQFKAITASYQDMYKALLEGEKLRRDVFEQMADKERKFQIEEMKRNGDNIGAIRAETAENLRAHDLKVAQIRKLGALTAEQEKAAASTRGAIVSTGKAGEDAETQKQIEAAKSKQLDIQQRIYNFQRLIEQADIDRLRREGDTIGVIKAEGDLRMTEFDKQVTAMKKIAPLSAANEKIIAQARIAIAESTEAQLQEIRAQAYQATRKQDEEGYGQIVMHLDQLKREYEAMNGTTIEGIRQELADRLDAIDAQKAAFEDQQNALQFQLDTMKDITAEQREQMDIEIRKLQMSKEQADQAKAAASKNAAAKEQRAPSQEFEKPMKVGQQIASTLSSGATGIMGSALGFAGAANMILDAVQALIDFIPSILSKVANVVTSLTDLPNKLADGIVNINAALLKFVQSFLPNIISAATKILESGLEFFQELPKVFQNMIKTLPDMITKFVDKLPQLVEDTMRATIDALPEMMSSLVEVIIKKGPAIGMKIAEAFIITVPRAIANGVLEALGDIGKMISGGFKGLGESAAAGAVTGFASALKGITTQSSKLFSVIDASATARGVDTAKAIASAIESATNSASRVLGQLWKALKDLWNYVDATIIKPFIASLTAAWNAIYANVIQPLIAGITNAWNWVDQHIVQPLAGVVSTAFSWVVDHVLSPLGGVVASAFSWVSSNILGPMGSFVASAFAPVRDIFNSLSNFPSWVSNLGGTVNVLQNTFGWVSQFGGTVNRLTQSFGFVSDFKGIVDKLSGLSIVSQAGGSGGGGSIISKVTGGFFANGGPVMPHYAAMGLMIPRGNDTVPIMGEPGEFMLRRRAVKSLGAQTVADINATGKLPAQGPQVISLGGITIQNHGDKVDAAFVRQTIMPVVAAELKKASVNGRFTISNKGVRNV